MIAEAEREPEESGESEKYEKYEKPDKKEKKKGKSKKLIEFTPSLKSESTSGYKKKTKGAKMTKAVATSLSMCLHLVWDVKQRGGRKKKK